MNGDRRQWLRADGDGVVLSIHAQPGARKSEIAGLYGAALKIRLAAPAVEGKANAELIAFLASRLGVARACLRLLSGETARAKRLRIEGLSADQVGGLLSPTACRGD